MSLPVYHVFHEVLPHLRTIPFVPHLSPVCKCLQWYAFFPPGSSLSLRWSATGVTLRFCSKRSLILPGRIS
ncbi:hypothetical protein KP509_29G072300 [Ceratopteris richardii]|uniref:Uncharacterized protein n=1 Tax=Ceratopteris richardii TaxID=49495 RepID=A0A8T2RAK7_CERRI|nr:hypothetical protein KP509_29G072300 [Ceratopteris richardii]